MKVTTKGYYRVINTQGVEVSKHIVFQKALESAVNTKSPTVLFPDKIELIHDITVIPDTIAPDTLTLTSIQIK